MWFIWNSATMSRHKDISMEWPIERIITLNGYFGKDEDFVIKHIGACDVTCDYKQVFNFKPPYNYSEIPQRYQEYNTFTNLRYLDIEKDWAGGFIENDRVSDVLKWLISDTNLVVTDDVRMLKNLVKDIDGLNKDCKFYSIDIYKEDVDHADFIHLLCDVPRSECFCCNVDADTESNCKDDPFCALKRVSFFRDLALLHHEQVYTNTGTIWESAKLNPNMWCYGPYMKECDFKQYASGDKMNK